MIYQTSRVTNKNIMNLTTLTSRDLSRIQKLIERKESLTQQIAEINSELEAMESGASQPARLVTHTNGATAAPSARKSSKAVTIKKRKGKTVRGQLKEIITSELKSAGNKGMRVKDLAAKLGTSYGNVTAFFQSTGKKIKEIKKIGRGQFAWTGV